MKQVLIILFSVFISSAVTQAQTKTTANDQTPAASVKPNQPVPLPADLVAFLVGEWEGTGRFASGKEIQADVKFSSVLDDQWLLYNHQDRAPNKYKALGMWGFERGSGKFVMVVHDNFGGARRFESDGWKDGKVIFVNSVNTPPISYSERFIFERVTERSFKMSYETNKDGKEWKLGDYLIFTRKP